VKLAGRPLQLRATKVSSTPGMIERMVTIDDLTRTNRHILRQIAPAVRRLSKDLSELDFSNAADRHLIVDMARQVQALERICRLSERPASE